MSSEFVRQIKFGSTASTLDAHLRATDPHVFQSACFQWMLGPVSKQMPGLSVIEASGEDRGTYFHYLSSGASDVDCGGNTGLEFCFKTADRDSRHIELLSLVAYMHRDPKHHLDVGHTMKIGRPLVPGSILDRVLVSLPYPYGPDFEYVHLSQRRHARILWLVPISESEEALRHSQGLEALEKRFEDEEIDFLDAHRRSIV